MKICNDSARFLIAILTLAIGVTSLLFSNFAPRSWIPPWIDDLDPSCVLAIFSSDTRVCDYATDTKTITVRTLGSHPEKSLDFQRIQITDDPDHIFEATPPTPLDYAIILQRLYDQGYRRVVIATRMTWDQPAGNTTSPTPAEPPVDGFDEQQLSTQALSAKLAQFNCAVIALPVTRGATSQPLPAPLRRAIIPLNQVQGSPHLIPKVNQITLHASIDGGDSTLAGFHSIESAPPNPNSIPMLAHWIHHKEEGLIPSIELLTIMSAHNISPAEIQIECGQHIRLGQTGPTIPIDDYGQTLSPPAESQPLSQKTHTPVPAETLIATRSTSTTDNKSPQNNSHNTNNKVALISAIGEKTTPTNTLTAKRLTQLIVLSETLPTPGEAVHYKKLPLGFEMLIILALAIITSQFLTFTTFNRHLAFALTIPFVLILLLTLMHWNQQWCRLTTPVITILTTWLISSQVRKSDDDAQQPEVGHPESAVKN